MGELLAYRHDADHADGSPRWFAPVQVRNVIKEEDGKAREALRKRLDAMVEDHVTRGLLRNGSTLRVGLDIFEEQADELIATLVKVVAPVSQDAGTFTLITQAFDGFLTYLDGELEGIIAKIDHELQDSQQSRAFGYAAKTCWTEKRNNLIDSLEMQRSRFLKASTETRYYDLAAVAGGDATPKPPRTSAPVEVPEVTEADKQIEAAKETEMAEKSDVPEETQPLAAHWHEMWAHVAVQLYTGKVTPGSREDIGKLMAEWLDKKHIDHTPEEVEACARQLSARLGATQRINSDTTPAFWEDLKDPAMAIFAWCGDGVGASSCPAFVRSGGNASANRSVLHSLTIRPHAHEDGEDAADNGDGASDCPAWIDISQTSAHSVTASVLDID